MEERDRITNNIKKLILSFSILNLPIIITEQYPKGLGHLIPLLRETIGKYGPIEKITFSCFGEDSFVDELKRLKAKSLIITGMETHICILQTALDALQQGYKVHLPEDAVCSQRKSDWQVGIEKMQRAGVIITSTETVIFELLERAGTPEFKAISKIIK
jgi:nicotinamidase-related amidase